MEQSKQRIQNMSKWKTKWPFREIHIQYVLDVFPSLLLLLTSPPCFLKANIKPEAEWKANLGLLLVSLSLSFYQTLTFFFLLSFFSSLFFLLYLWQVPTVSFSHDLRLKGNYPVRLEKSESIQYMHTHTHRMHRKCWMTTRELSCLNWRSAVLSVVFFFPVEMDRQWCRKAERKTVSALFTESPGHFLWFLSSLGILCMCALSHLCSVRGFPL